MSATTEKVKKTKRLTTETKAAIVRLFERVEELEQRLLELEKENISLRKNSDLYLRLIK